MPILTGTNVILRPYEPNDAQIILDSTSEPVGRWLTGTHATFTLEQIQRYIASALKADDRAGFIILDAQTRERVGEIVLMQIDPDNRSATLRIALFGTEHFGKGYGSEALRLVLGYGFEVRGLHRIGLDVFAYNDRAIHVYEKIGFRREGVQRDALFYDGAYHDSILMAILEDEWRQSPC
jgi:RimJ/RimL family protein N-acetyltransferase